jgi:hypothetical protein
MSSTIWTQSAENSEIGPLTADPWRVVEAQHLVSTRKLVDSDREQAVLEEMLEADKPPSPAPIAGLHYLLFTPFRYPPLRRGSRFGGRWEPSLWYGAEQQRTAFAEVAYYRLLFQEGSEADLGLLHTDLTVFRVPVRTPRGVDLTRAPFNRWEALLASKNSYEATQPLGAAMRADGIEAFCYRSARDVEGGVNVGVFTPGAFAARRPRDLQTWRSLATRKTVEISKHDYFVRESHRFERENFLEGGELPRPAV